MSSRSLWDKVDKQERDEHAQQTKSALQDLAKEAFDIFDKNSTGSIESSDLGNVLRALGLNPSNIDIATMLENLEGKEDNKSQNPNNAKGSKPTSKRIFLVPFQNHVVQLLLENKMPRDDESTVRSAFEILDIEKKGYIEPEKLSSLLSTMGEPFTPEEIEDMFSLAVDPDKGVIYYENYSTLLAND
eukprot:TRINITY_DN6054_c0_g1_i1.p1 TRINITY_DN6054_c0_g1~~TRINITY_DN6054_c0_g1_i1.p1  ORF type:complete len:187 (-),score=45.32 TRINITY_DN6054_c0_g1_i1:69-629(-)